MAYSYPTKVYLETELCIEWASLQKMMGLVSDLIPISRRQMNKAILEECGPEPLVDRTSFMYPSRKIRFYRYEPLKPWGDIPPFGYRRNDV